MVYELPQGEKTVSYHSLWELVFGVPQRLVLGPLFIMYMSPLGKVLKYLGIQYHFYADNSQIYVTFNINEAGSAVTKIEEAIGIIKQCMVKNVLCLNDEKIEVLIASQTSHQKLNILHISIGNEQISPTNEAKR